MASTSSVGVECQLAPEPVFRTDLSPSGNRVISGTGSLTTTEPIVIELPSAPVWVVPYRTDESGATWLVTLESDEAVLVEPSGEVSISEVQLDGEPPEIRSSAQEPEIASAYDDQVLFPDALPDARVVYDGDLAVALVDPSDQYDHAVLGDRVEAKAFEVLDRCTGERTRTSVAEADVIEGIAPLLADIDGDGVLDVLVTVSNDESGSRLVSYSTGGTLIAQSQAIGQGGRWRNQLAVAPVGPNGEIEIIDVVKPHATGTLEYLRLVDGALVRVAETSRFTSHVIRSQNLDRGIVADADGDGQLDVIVQTFERDQLGVLTRQADEVDTKALIQLGSAASSNIAAARLVTGALSFAVGTEDGRLLVWNGS